MSAWWIPVGVLALGLLSLLLLVLNPNGRQVRDLWRKKDTWRS